MFLLIELIELVWFNKIAAILFGLHNAHINAHIRAFTAWDDDLYYLALERENTRIKMRNKDTYRKCVVLWFSGFWLIVLDRQ